MSDLIGVDLDLDALRDAYALAEAGAKKNVISALTRLKSAQANKLYLHVNGKSGSPGKHPESLTRYVRTVHHHFHSNYLYNLFSSLHDLGLPDSQVVLQSFKSYRAQFQSSSKVYDVNEVYRLFALLRQPDVVRDCCNECHSAYFLEPFELAMGSATCPFCRMVKRRQEASIPDCTHSPVVDVAPNCPAVA